MDVNLLLVGRTGNGKSSTGNSILGKKSFTPKISNDSVTEEILKGEANVDSKRGTVIDAPGVGDVDSRRVTVIDGPGVGDAGLDDFKGVDDTIKSVEKAQQMCPKGFHAILLVLPFGVRFTGQEKDAVKMLKGIFGRSVLENHGVIVLTRGDNFNADEEEGAKFKDWCKKQTGDFKELLEESKYRCVLFNNRTKNKGELDAQRKELFKRLPVIEPYEIDHYNKAKGGRKKLLLFSKLPILEERNRKFLEDIKGRMDLINLSGDLRNAISAISGLIDELSEHKAHMKEEIQCADLMKEKIQCADLLKNILIELDVVEMNLTTKRKLAQQKILVNESSRDRKSTNHRESASKAVHLDNQVHQQARSRDVEYGNSQKGPSRNPNRCLQKVSPARSTSASENEPSRENGEKQKRRNNLLCCPLCIGK